MSEYGASYNFCDREVWKGIVKKLQDQELPDGIKPLLDGKYNTPFLRRISSLSPFVDEEGLIRAGGRLPRAYLSFGRKHPILIPDVPDGDALIGFIHAKRAQHQGRVITASTLRDEGYIPLGGRRRLSRILEACQRCRKLRAKPMEQKMADLPTFRLEETPPFERCGIDVFGPFLVQHGRVTRAHPGSKKIWVLIFRCLYTCGIHLETLDHMDVASFKMAFTRFQNFRGSCKYLRSDAGSNFMGARNLEERHAANQLLMEARMDPVLSDLIWEINPPLASHFGGVWERAIRSVRKVIDAVLMDLHVKLLTEEEFRTLLSEAACVVNSTPLWTMSDVANEPMPLSPAMILNQREAECSDVRDRNEEEDPAAYGPRRWKRMNFLKNRFWQEWSRYYLFERPYGRTKWLKTRPNAKPGDVVLMREKNRPRLDWNEGVITQVKVDEDGLVRKAMVKPIHREGKTTTTQERERAVHDLVFLNSNQSSHTESPTDPSKEIGPAEPPSCNKLNICPFCDLDLTTGRFEPMLPLPQGYLSQRILSGITESGEIALH